MEANPLVDQRRDFLHGVSAGDAARKVGDVSAETAVFRRFDGDEVFHSQHHKE